MGFGRGFGWEGMVCAQYLCCFRGRYLFSIAGFFSSLSVMRLGGGSVVTGFGKGFGWSDMVR